MDSYSRPSTKRWPRALRIGSLITGIYLIFLIFCVFLYRDDILSQKISDLGNTLSGAAAPLAFLWLVVATFLQMEELALTREELRLTRSVMADQMEETKKSAAATQRLADLEEENKLMAQNEYIDRRLNIEIDYLFDYIKLYSDDIYVYVDKNSRNRVSLSYRIKAIIRENSPSREQFIVQYSELLRERKGIFPLIQDHTGGYMPRTCREKYLELKGIVSNILNDQDFKSDIIGTRKISLLKIDDILYELNQFERLLQSVEVGDEI